LRRQRKERNLKIKKKKETSYKKKLHQKFFFERERKWAKKKMRVKREGKSGLFCGNE